MSWFSGTRARLRLLFGRRAAESRMEEEIRFHIDMEAERLERDEGLDAAEARRRALVSFGGVDRTREELRDGRGLAWMSGLRLDVKLGARMLARYPILTTASILALTIAVAMAASWFQFMGNMVWPELPVPDGDRIVRLRNVDVEAAETEPRILHDFEAWREELRAVEDLAAFSSVPYSASTADGRYGWLDGVRVTPSVFRLARVQPALGRVISEADAVPGADPVVVLSHEAWQRLYDGDPAAVGQPLRLNGIHATVIGVMPEGYAFPVNEQLWTPLQDRAVSYDRREGPAIGVLGRLAPGVTEAEAQAELEVVGRRASAAFPATHEHLRAELRRFGRGNDMAGPAALLNIPFLLFLLVVSANVATLLLARTASRESEIALRSALGASRRRIVLQLVAESLVITGTAAALGLTISHYGMKWGMDLFWQVQQERPPSFFDGGVSVASALYTAALALVGALIIGGLPGLRATRRGLRDRLPQTGSAGGGVRFGLIATAVIVLQVALCVAFLPIALMNGRDLLAEARDSDFPAHAFLTGTLVTDVSAEADAPAGPRDDAGGASPDSVPAPRAEELLRRLEAEPDVLAATRASRIAGLNHPVSPIRIEGDSASDSYVRQLAVDPDYFEVMDIAIVGGRGFTRAEADEGLPVAVVNEEWAREVFAGRNPVGRRIRFPGRGGEEEAEWVEVVGVVAGADRASGPAEQVAVFRPMAPGAHAGVQLFLRAAGDPDAMVSRVVGLVAAVDPRFTLHDPKPLDDVWRPVRRANVFFVAALQLVGAIILLFALMGIYALLSFTVARRAREIGIRAALGAEPRRIITTIFSRAMAQIGLGVVLGALLVSLTIFRDREGLRLVAGVAAAMVVVGMLGCVVPAARALRIQPTDALRAE